MSINTRKKLYQHSSRHQRIQKEQTKPGPTLEFQGKPKFKMKNINSDDADMMRARVRACVCAARRHVT